MKKNSHNFSIPGISLLLLIFLSLCLITFSLLSLSASTADQTLSQKAADRTLEYYEASRQANEKLSEIDAVLAGYLIQAETDTDPSAAYQELCRNLPKELSYAASEDSAISFSVDVTDSQILQVRLETAYPEQSFDPLYRITCWKIINTGDWNPDTKQNVLKLDPETNS